MDLAPITLILLIFNIGLTIWSIRALGLTVQAGIDRLDAQLAGAIQKVVEGDLAGSFEPVNPIQQAIAQMLSSRIESAPVDMKRAEDGTFE